MASERAAGHLSEDEEKHENAHEEAFTEAPGDSRPALGAAARPSLQSPVGPPIWALRRLRSRAAAPSARTRVGTTTGASSRDHT